MITEAATATRQRRMPWLTWAVLLDVRLQIALATLTGVLLRIWDLSSVPPGLNQDEAVYGYDAYSIFMTGRDHLGHPFPFASLETFGDWSSPLLTYLSIPAVAVFGLNVEVLRGVSALLGAAAIPIVYCLAMQLFRRRDIATASMCVIAILPWAVHLSRWAIIPTVVPTMVAATMLVAVWALQNHNPRAIVAAGLLAGLTVAAYHAMKVYVPLLLLALVGSYWRDLRRISVEFLAYAGALFLVVAGPILYLTARDPGGGARLAQTSVLNDHSLSPQLLLSQYASYFSPSFWFFSGDGDPMHLPAGQGLFPLTLAPFLLAGLAYIAYLSVRRPDTPVRRNAGFLLLALALYPAAGMLTLPSPHVLRAVHVIPLAALVAGAGLVGVFDLVRAGVAARKPAWALSTVAVLGLSIATVVAVDVGLTYKHYFTQYPEEVAENFRYGTKDALQYVAAHEADYDEVWLDDNNSSYIYVLFYHRWDPSDVHRDLAVRRNPPDWNRAVSIGKYRFGTPEDVTNRQELFASRYGGSGAGYSVSSATTGSGRILIVAQTK